MSDHRVARLAFEPPYDWESLQAFLATRAVPGVERIDASGYVRTLRGARGTIIIRVQLAADERALLLRIQGEATDEHALFERTARRVFDVDAQPTALLAAFSADPLLAPLVQRRPGLRIAGAWDPFECAVRAVLGQQVSVAAARTLAARLVARAGEPAPDNEAGLTHLFPSPAALAHANLDGLGVTGARIRALQTLARAVLDGAVSFTLDTDAFVAQLSALPGFGVWTAQYIALRALGDRDAFLAGDLVLQRMAGLESRLTARTLELRAQRWRPFRAYAVMHLWRAAAERASR